MKFVVERAPLAAALTRVGKIVKRGTTATILNNVRLEAVANKVRLTTSDVDSSVEVDVEAMVSDAGDVTVGVHALSGFISGVPDGAQVEMQWDPETSRLTVRAGRGRAKLATLAAHDFPPRPDLIEPGEFMLPGKELARALGRVAHAVCTEETRYYLCGVYMRRAADNPKRLTFVATDGHRLGQAHLDMGGEIPDFTPPIIPRHAIGELIDMAKNNEAVDLAITHALMRASVPGTVYTTKLIDGTYPDIQRVIPATSDYSFETARAELLATSRRAAVICDNGKDGRILKLSTSRGLIELKGDGSYGEIHDELDAHTEGGDIEVNFNVAFAADALGAFTGGPIHCRFEKLGAIIFTEPGDASHLQLVMSYGGQG
jgi:DNA polymerase-3 subunit beta